MEVQLVNSNRQLLDHHHHHHEWEFLRPFFKRLLRHFLATFLLTIQVPPMAITSIVFLFSYLHPPPPPPPPPSHATLVRKFSSLFYFSPISTRRNQTVMTKHACRVIRGETQGFFFSLFFITLLSLSIITPPQYLYVWQGGIPSFAPGLLYFLARAIHT